MSNLNVERPLSGEIIDVQQACAPVQPVGGADVIDAEFVSVAPDANHSTANLSAPPVESPVNSAGMDMLKRRLAPDSGVGRQKAGPAFYLVGAAIALTAFWISGGHTLMPNIGAVNAEHVTSQPLRIASVNSRVETQGGKSLLFVDGEIFNSAANEVTIPDISINVLDHGGQTTRYYLGTNQRRIDAGARFDFSSRLHVPKDGVKSVSVTLKENPG